MMEIDTEDQDHLVEGHHPRDRRGSMFTIEANMQSKLMLRQGSSCMQTFTDDPSDFTSTLGMKKAPKKYQNTFKLDPDDRFPTNRVEKMAEDVLKDHLEDMDYDENVARRLCKIISDKLLQSVKKLQCKRHKIVVLVNIGQLIRQGVRFGSRCLWQPQHDNFAEASFEGRTIWATATVYGVYQD